MRIIIRNAALGLILALSLFASARTTSAKLSTVTTVLLPEEVVSVTLQKDADCKPTGYENMLMVSADGSSPIKLQCAIRLGFDLKTIPSGARITKATMRLVGIPVNDNPQLVRIFTNAPGQGLSIGKWTTKSGQTIFDATSEKLVGEVIKASETENQSLSLWLLSKSRLSSWNYYSLKDFGRISAQKPRLILEYQIDRSPTLPTDRTAWKFFLKKTTFKSKNFRANLREIISNPVFYKNSTYLFAKPTDTRTNLYALHSNGRDNWYTSINVPPGANALVNSEGILYSIGENRIALYDLNKKGEPMKSISLDDFRLSNPPGLGADSSLYFTRYGYLYGLNQEAKELWRYPPDDARAEKISRISLSPDVQKNVYALMRIANKNKFLSINTATGSSAAYAFDNKYTFFHHPLTIERQGKDKDYILISAYSEVDGMLSCYWGGEKIWTTAGPVSQPASDMAGNLIYVIQNGKLQAIDILNGQLVDASSQTDLEATSNLVLDGDDNVYFWNNGRFFVFTKQCELLVEKELPDLPKRLELLFSPDGTLYARNIKDNKLALVLPTRQELTLNQDNFQNNTIYSADALRVAKNMQLAATASIALKASDRISIGTGFSVKKGARLTCKTGF